MFMNCFKTYYAPIFIYVKRVGELAVNNDFDLLKFSLSSATIGQFCMMILNIDYFGVPRLLLLIVIATVFLDAYYGIKRSKMLSAESLVEAKEHHLNSPEYKAHMKRSELLRFQPKKLQFTFFKCFTLLFYLFVVKNLMEYTEDSESIATVVGFATGVLTKAPIALFWYYDFKSIGQNTEKLYGKKAPIFIIVEKLFEPKIKELYNNKTDE